MKTPFKELLGILIIGAFITILALSLKHLQKEPSPLENIEKKLDEAAKKDSVLTTTEKELEQKATEKEWEEVDKQTDK